MLKKFQKFLPNKYLEKNQKIDFSQNVGKKYKKKTTFKSSYHHEII